MMLGASYPSRLMHVAVMFARPAQSEPIVGERQSQSHHLSAHAEQAPPCLGRPLRVDSSVAMFGGGRAGRRAHRRPAGLS